MISKTGLKPYHMNRLQEAQQQLIAEALAAYPNIRAKVLAQSDRGSSPLVLH